MRDASIVEAVEDEARSRGYLLITASCDEDPGLELELVAALRRRGVDEAQAVVRELLGLPGGRRPAADGRVRRQRPQHGRCTAGPARRAGGVAVVGFDDLELADLLAVPATVVRGDPHRLGTIAAERAFARVDGDTGPPASIVLPTELVVRGSGELAPP